MVTLFVKDVGEENGPLGYVIAQIAFGSTPVDRLVGEGDKDVDIAVTGNIRTALNMLKETESTVVVVVVLSRHDQSGADSLAQNYPDRVRVHGVMDMVLPLLALIAEKEAANASSAN
jgi:3-dehydroquinate synthase class II